VGLLYFLLRKEKIMTKTKKQGELRAEALYNSLDVVERFITEAAAILRKSKPSAEEMKQVEQLKNLARVKIGEVNQRREILILWEKLAAGTNSVAGIVVKKFRKAA